MALLACPECTNSISSRAKTCPHCGVPLDVGAERAEDRLDSPTANAPATPHPPSSGLLTDDPRTGPRFSFGADLALRLTCGVSLLGLAFCVTVVFVALLPFRQVPPALTIAIALVLWKLCYGYALQRLRLRPAPLQIPRRWAERIRAFLMHSQLALWVAVGVGVVWACLQQRTQTRNVAFVASGALALLAISECLVFYLLWRRFEPEPKPGADSSPLPSSIKSKLITAVTALLVAACAFSFVFGDGDGETRHPERRSQANQQPRTASFDLVQLAKAAAPAVVSIQVLDLKGNTKRIGTGFWVSGNGELVTNLHVLEGGSEVAIKFTHEAISTSPDSELLRLGGMPAAEGILAYSEEWDLAVLKFSEKSKHFVALGSAEFVQVGEPVAVIGNPQGLEGTVSQGVVSAKREINPLAPVLQITAPISPGSSGSPVFDKRGKVVAVASAYVGLKGSQGLNFAVPAEAVAALLARSTSAQAKPLASLYEDRATNLSNTATRLFREGKLDDALAAFAAASKLHAELPKQKLEEAMLAKDTAEKILLLRELVFYHPSYPNAWRELNIALVKADRFEEAQPVLETFFKLVERPSPKREAFLKLLVHHPQLRLKETVANQLRDIGIHAPEGRAAVAKILAAVRAIRDDRILREVERALSEYESEAKELLPNPLLFPRPEFAHPGPLRGENAARTVAGPR